MDINRRTMADLYVAYLAAFQGGLSSREDANAWQQIATLVPSRTASNVYPWLGQFPKLREWLDERMLKALKAHRYEVINKDYESSVEVERNAVEDDQYLDYASMFTEAGIAAAEWPNDVVFSALKLGETVNGYDGVPFFSANHPHDKEGTVSNLDAGSAPAWYLLDTTRAIKPMLFQRRRPPRLTRLDRDTDPNVFHHKKFIYGIDARGAAGFALWQLAHKSKATLNAESYEEARVAMMERTNNEGSSLGIRPNLLVVPPELEIPARKVVQASQNAQGATNVLAGTASVFVTNLIR